MQNFETENYLVEVLPKGHRVVDKCQQKETPVDECLDNYKTLKEAFETRKVIFDTVCKSLINVSGERMYAKKETTNKS